MADTAPRAPSDDKTQDIEISSPLPPLHDRAEGLIEHEEMSEIKYDDGGFSGATTDRPALQRLLADVTAGRVDTIVVYKIDRLTRSLADFAKIVEVLDTRGASFVSVTQQFNTTTSMGRLTLNILCLLRSSSAR